MRPLVNRHRAGAAGDLARLEEPAIAAVNAARRGPVAGRRGGPPRPGRPLCPSAECAKGDETDTE